MTSTGLMRRLLPSRLFRTTGLSSPSSTTAASTPFVRTCDTFACSTPQECRCFAQVQDNDRFNREVFFRASTPSLSLQPGPQQDHKPPDERTLQLGKTVRVLHDRLPTLLLSPLPSEILSPQITLHLFPSTHPHLPTVSGRIAYVAALWTAPVAWGRIPLVGNVKLTILSERMVRNGGTTSSSPDQRDEKLIVKWKTCGKTRHRDGSGGIYRGVGIGARDPVDKIKEFISGGASARVTDRREEQQPGEEFCGIFVFEFDEKGKIRKHVIEHTEEGGHFDRMTRVVSVTDWLLGQFGGKNREEGRMPELAFCDERRKKEGEERF